MNVVTGGGLAEAVVGKDVVIDVTRPPQQEMGDVEAFFTKGTRNALEAEVNAEVKHHLVLSVVGAERMDQPGSWLRAKAAQEEAVRAGGVPFTILRATQFFEFLRTIADSATVGGAVTLPMVPIQPVAVDDTAQALTDLALGAPHNDVVEVAGPDRAPMVDLIRRALKEMGDRRRFTGDEAAIYMGMRVGPTSLVPLGDALTAATTLEEWLVDQT